MRVGTHPTRNFATLAETCVFSKQSLGPLCCNLLGLPTNIWYTLREAPLLPKLRGQFAEFLNGGSLARLSILSQPTCVSLRYGHPSTSPRGFSLAAGVNPFPSIKGRSPSQLGINEGTDLPIPSPLLLGPGISAPGGPILLRHPLGLAAPWVVPEF